MKRLHYLALPIGLVLIAGCKQDKTIAPPSDQQVTSAIQAKLAGDQSLQGQVITPVFSRGTATLTGTSADEGSRERAGADAGSVTGVRTVINDLTVPSELAAFCAPPKPARVRAARRRVVRRAPIEQAYAPSPLPAPLPPPPARVQAPLPPAYVVVAPPPPVLLVPGPVAYRRYWR